MLNKAIHNRLQKQMGVVGQKGQEPFYSHIFHLDSLNISKQQSCQGWFPAFRLFFTDVSKRETQIENTPV